MYSNHGLFEVFLFLLKSKNKLVQQINSFRVLADRYKVLSEHQESIDIMRDA